MGKKYTRRRHGRRHRRNGKRPNGPTLRSRKKRADIFAFLNHTGGYKHTKTPGEQLISSPRKTKTKTKTRRSKTRKNFKWTNLF